MTTKKTTEAKSKYVVIKKNTLGHKIGDVIELTEKRAKALSGKVQKQSAKTASESTQDAQIKALENENTLLKEEVERLTALVAGANQSEEKQATKAPAKTTKAAAE